MRENPLRFIFVNVAPRDAEGVDADFVRMINAVSARLVGRVDNRLVVGECAARNFKILSSRDAASARAAALFSDHMDDKPQVAPLLLPRTADDFVRVTLRKTPENISTIFCFARADAITACTSALMGAEFNLSDGEGVELNMRHLYDAADKKAPECFSDNYWADTDFVTWDWDIISR